MSASSNPTDEELFEFIRDEALASGDVIELGSSTEGAMFEKMRVRLTHGEVLKTTFDRAVLKRCRIAHEDKVMPPAVDPATFDADVQRITNMTPDEALTLDDEICHARMETRCETGGVYCYPKKTSGYGRDVFGISYDAVTGGWNATNECGLHGHTEEFLVRGGGYVENTTGVISGLIFQIPSMKTPIMIPYGYPFKPVELMCEAVEDLWGWKRFILLGEDMTAKNPLYNQLFTSAHMKEMCEYFRR